MPQPVRTCIGCRATAGKRDLLRIVDRPDGPMVDALQLEPGRGAYLHRSAACLELAVKRKALSRALRLGHSVIPDAVRAAVAPHLTGTAKQSPS